MLKKTIEHPFHKISFDYDETKAWTPRDEKLLNLYIQLHDSESKQHESARSLQRMFGEHSRKVELLRKELKVIREKLNATRTAADHVVAQANLQVPQAVESFVKQVNETNDAIQDYDKKVRELEKEMKELHAIKEKYHEKEDEGSLWDRLSELKITYAYDNRLSIDYVSFDDDEERFREKVTFINHQNDNYINSCNNVIDNYSRLMLETEVQYEVWKEFGKRMMLIQEITGRNSGLTEISSN